MLKQRLHTEYFPGKLPAFLQNSVEGWFWIVLDECFWWMISHNRKFFQLVFFYKRQFVKILIPQNWLLYRTDWHGVEVRPGPWEVGPWDPGPSLKVWKLNPRTFNQSLKVGSGDAFQSVKVGLIKYFFTALLIIF